MHPTNFGLVKIDTEGEKLDFKRARYATLARNNNSSLIHDFVILGSLRGGQGVANNGLGVTLARGRRVAYSFDASLEVYPNLSHPSQRVLLGADQSRSSFIRWAPLRTSLRNRNTEIVVFNDECCMRARVA